jgi:hypothetical protein
VSGDIPAPRPVLHWRAGAVVALRVDELMRTPESAKVIITAVLKLLR